MAGYHYEDKAKHIGDCGSVVYLDFIRDVKEVSELLKQGGLKVGKYTGQMQIKD